MSRFDGPLGELLNPGDIEIYLLARGWDADRRTSAFSTWTHPDDPQKPSVFVPLSSRPHDYEERLQELVTRLAEIEDQDRDVLVTNLRYATADLVRIRLVSERVGRGELPIEDGAELFTGAREMMFAAACAAVAPRPSFGGRAPQMAVDYLEAVRLGQTEPGSYVVTVISNVPPAEQRPLLPSEAAFLDVPFERQVTNKLVTALGAAYAAADAVISDGAPMAVFDDAVDSGVSANLCDAVAKMGAESVAAKVRVAVDWASSRPPTLDARPVVAFGPAALPVLHEAVSHLRALGPFENELIEGYVSQLTRGTEDEIGTIVIEGQARGTSRRVHVELPDDQYDAAVEAHRARRPVHVRGTLFKKGRFWILSEPGHLTVE